MKNVRMAIKRLTKEFKQLTSEHDDYIVAGPIDEDNIFEWEAMIQGPGETPYEGGCFRCTLTFPKDYPFSPPKMRFTSKLWHPNIYKDGRVCISILHRPGDDPHHYELSCERWTPSQSVATILRSVLSMLADPNPDSPANVDAAKQFRSFKNGTDKTTFCKRVEADVMASLRLDSASLAKEIQQWKKNE